MLYHLDTEERSAGGRSGTVYTLSRTDDGSKIEIWPSHGCNLLHWSVPAGELVYADAGWSENAVPTRSGIPVLFPYPNRIRDGKFTFGGKEYVAPKNDSTAKNSIHGSASRNAWKVVGYGTDDDSAYLHAEFRIGRDAPTTLPSWPGDAVLNITYRFTGAQVKLDILVENPNDTPIPFGLGFHPYFCIPGSAGLPENPLADYRLHAPARNVWELYESLPTGQKREVPDAINWNRPRPIGDTPLDTVYGDLGTIAEENGLHLRAELGRSTPGALQVWTSPAFRESVLFTPVHRKAVCIEPYTCVTDAVNLQPQGIDAGLRTLAPGASWAGTVLFRWVADRVF